MKKANQKEATLKYTATDLERILGYLDGNGRKRRTFEESLNRETQRARNLEATISSSQIELEGKQKKIASMQVEMDALPHSAFTTEDAKTLLDKVAALPWIEKAELTGTQLHLWTREGVLKTDFYNRMVVGNGDRCTELLQEILTLPLPQYELSINLSNMGGTWANNPDLSIRLANRKDWSSFAADQGSWVQETRAHWACNNSSAGEWGQLCLGDYDNVLWNSSKKGLMEMLTDLAIYLQSSGWSAAYINKMAWATLLGNPVYNQYLLRPFARGEDIDSITKLNRERLPDFLKRNNLSKNQYLYGSDSTDDEVYDEDECSDCGCTSRDNEDGECECDCHD